MLDQNCSFQNCRWFTKNYKTCHYVNLFCLLFMEFISLNVKRLCFLRNFHTVLQHDCTSLQALQPCRRLPDIQAPSAFIFLVGFLLIVILTRMRWYIPVALFWVSYCLAVVSIFLLPPSHGKEQAARPASAAVGHRLSLPTACRVFLDQDEALVPCSVRWILHHRVTSQFSFFSFWDIHIHTYIYLFIYLFIYLNIIALQCSASLCCMTSSINRKCT